MNKWFSKLESVYEHRKIIILLSVSFVFGIILGGNILEKYLAVIVGFFTALIAFLGVAYAQNKQSVLIRDQLSHASTLQRKKLIHEQRDDKRKFRLEKSEEILINMHSFNIDIIEKNGVIKDERLEIFLSQLGQIITLQELYGLGETDSFSSYKDAALNIVIFFINLRNALDKLEESSKVTKAEQVKLDELRVTFAKAHRSFHESIIEKNKQF